jgi:nucleoside 2-deoxyribosyltransferase
MSGRVVRAVLSGSFRKDYEGLVRAYTELVTCGVQVLSPHRLDFKDEHVLFVRDTAEKDTSEETLERHHLLGIQQADFLWVHLPDGYVGVSTAFEIGFALAKNIPVYSESEVGESCLRPFIQTVPSVFRALELTD